MPLKPGCGSRVREKNIRTMIAEGYAPRRAVAAAYRTERLTCPDAPAYPSGMAKRRKVCMSVAEFERLVKHRSCSCKKGKRSKKRKHHHGRMPPRTKSGRFRKSRKRR